MLPKSLVSHWLSQRAMLHDKGLCKLKIVLQSWINAAIGELHSYLVGLLRWEKTEQ